ncbi:MAG TPA: septum formation initiator family protein [Desulfotomaculum sp.]|nr:septum formation initiator family protein [Desulfotomaculum sp.]
MTLRAPLEEKHRPGRVRINPSRLATVLFLFLLVYLLVLVGGQFARLRALERSVVQAKEELDAVKAHNRLLWEQVRLLQSDAYVESLARDGLGLVKPGEVPVIIQKSEVGSQKSEGSRCEVRSSGDRRN